MIIRNTRTHLLNDSAVSTLVSTRIFPNVIPQNVSMPAIRLSTVTGSTYTTHKNQLLGKARSVVQIDAYANDYATAENLAEKIRLACHQHKGTWGSLYATVHKTDERTFEDMPADGSSVARRVVSQDFSIIHNEATS